VSVPPRSGAAWPAPTSRGGGIAGVPEQAAHKRPIATRRSARVRSFYTAPVLLVIPLVWLSAFVAGRWIGIVPAVGAASALLSLLVLATQGRSIQVLFRLRVRPLLIGLVAAPLLVAACYAGFAVLAPRLPALARGTAELYARFPERGPAQAVVIVLVVLAEEILWRGALQSALAPRCGRATTLGAALVYALAHVTAGSLLLVVMALVLGALWSLLRALTDSLWPPLLTHLAFDLALLFLRPLQ